MGSAPGSFESVRTESGPNAEQEPAKQDPAKKGPAKKELAKKAVADRNHPFDRRDTNKNGVLTLEEFKAGRKAGENFDVRFRNFDKNGDGKLTREEFVGPAKKQPPSE